MEEDRVVKIRMLGEFLLSWGDITVSARSSRSYKIWLFLAYLLYHHDRMLTREELLELLDDDSDRNSDPVRMLRNIRWNARRTLEPISDALDKELILSRGGDSGWNPEVPAELDVERFEALCAQADGCGDPETRIGLLRQALSLMQGGFLEQFQGDFWVSQLAAHYQSRYVDIVLETLPLLLEAGCWQEAADLSRAAIRTEPYHEPLYRFLMRSLMGMENYREADTVFQTLREKLSELDILPDEASQTLYQELLHYVGDRSISPDLIRERLREQSRPTGALICDYATFRMFYQVEARSADRRGDAIHIGILSVAGRQGKELSDRSLRKAMENLKKSIQETLRVGDVAASCSASQYIILLVQANFENSRMVCDRVVRHFRLFHPHSPAEIVPTVLPLEPLFGDLR